MSDFVPEGYVPINAALMAAACNWSEPAISKCLDQIAGPPPAETRDLSMRFENLTQYQVTVLQRDPEFLRAVKSAEQRLRQALFAGSITAVYPEAIFGGLATIEKDRWANDELDDAITSGQFYPYGRPTYAFDAKKPAAVLVEIDVVDRLLDVSDGQILAGVPTVEDAPVQALRGDTSSNEQSILPSRKGIGGRSYVADWLAHEEALLKEIEAVGFPSRNGVPGWQTKADVVRWIGSRLGDDETAEPNTIRSNLDAMLERIKAKLAENSVASSNEQ